MTLAWCKNGCEGEVDPLVSEASCSPSAIQVSEEIGHVLDGGSTFAKAVRQTLVKGGCMQIQNSV